MTQLNIAEPLLLPDVKDELLVAHNEDDARLTLLIKEVREAVEARIKVHLVPTDVVAYIHVESEFKIPRIPVVTFTKAEVRTSANTYVELTANTDYERIAAKFYPQRTGIHRLTWVAGYDESSTDNKVPYSLKLAMKHEIAYRYENKGDKNAQMCEQARRLLNPFKNTAWL